MPVDAQESSARRALMLARAPGVAFPAWLVVVLAGLVLLFVILLFVEQRRRSSGLAFDRESQPTPREMRGYILALVDAGRMEDAASGAHRHLMALPTDDHMRALLAALQINQRDYAGACVEFEHTLAHARRQSGAITPATASFLASVYVIYAQTLRTLGRMSDALAMEHEALGFDPAAAGMSVGGVELLSEYVRSDELERQAYEDLPRWERDRTLAVPFGIADLNGAVRFFTGAVAANPMRARLHADLAQALHASGDHQGAEREFREALRLDPGDAWAHYMYGLMQWRLQRMDEAERALNEALLIAPAQAGILCTRAVFMLRQGRPAEAERDAALAAQVRPDVSTVAWLRGIVAQSQGHIELAARAFEDAERLGATDLGFRLAYASAREALGDAPGAAEQYRLALRLDTENGPARVAFAAFLFRQGRLYEAESEAQEALRLEGGQDAHELLARIYVLEQRVNEVVPQLRVAMQLAPASIALKALQAEWFVVCRRPDQAEEVTQSILQAPDLPAEGYFVRGTALRMLGRDLEAEAALNEALNLDPALPDRLLFQARALRQGGWLGPALDAVGRALLLQPEWPEALDERDAVLEAQRTRVPRRRLTFGPRRAS